MTVEEFEKKIKMWGDLCGLPTDTSSGKGQDAFDALKKVLSDDDIDEEIIDTNISVACQNHFLKNGLDGMIKFVVSVVMSLNKMHNEELAALKEKSRWRKQSEEPAPMGKDVEVYSPIQERAFCYFSPRIVPSYWYWRPMDLPNLPEDDAK